MIIGILTFYKEINFGANLQALSTYSYLKKHGYTPIFIYYCSKEKEKMWGVRMDKEIQPRCHKDFIDAVIKEQTEVCRNADDINEVIVKYGIDALIVGSDAVLQHHPFRDRIHLSRRIISIGGVLPESTFPNPFWGVDINQNIKMALMSASCQDSEFNHFSLRMKRNMREALNRFCYISVRDTWTQNMVKTILDEDNQYDIPITPDPVFNFNENVGELISSRQFVLEKFHLPDKYVLISLFGQHLSETQLENLKEAFSHYDIACVALPVQLGMMFKHTLDFEIPVPLNPLDWYGLIKYSSGYIGNNMHPIVAALHNAIPCFSLDFYGTKNVWGKPRKEQTSKVLHILKQFGVEYNYCRIVHGKASVDTDTIVKCLLNFPKDKVKEKADVYSENYLQMMKEITYRFN